MNYLTAIGKMKNIYFSTIYSISIPGCQPSDTTADASGTCGVYRDEGVRNCNHSAGKFF